MNESTIKAGFKRINDKKVVWTHSGYMPGNEVLVVDKALETIGKK